MLNKSPFTRRSFLKTSLVAAAGAASLPITTHAFGPQTTYIRYDVMSAQGQQALQSYSAGITKMLEKPPTDPQNWFRNAFIHMMDCPHGNWWFYVWHRGYVGYFEETIRNLSGDANFAIPYWDWTTTPEIPQSMFETIRNPTYQAYEPFTKDLEVFTNFIKEPLHVYWGSLKADQRNQLVIRGYNTFDDMWNAVLGNGNPGDMSYATTANSRYLTSQNSQLAPEVAAMCSPETIAAGLEPIQYYNPDIALSFTSTKTPSHMTPPGSGTSFSMLEGLPHNNVHNNIGGLGPSQIPPPGPYGYMANFLSPVDPVFFLHHANMDRLWDEWTRKQQTIGQPILPSGQDFDDLSNEKFMFFVDGNGAFVPPTNAGQYLSTGRFRYTYGPPASGSLKTSKARPTRKGVQVKGVVKGNTATLTVPSSVVKEHLASPTLVAAVTVPYPSTASEPRAYRVLVGAPANVTDADAKSPYFAGTIAFFGSMSHGHGTPGYATFAVPLPRTQGAFKGLSATNTAVDIRIVPIGGQTQRPLLRSAVIRAL